MGVNIYPRRVIDRANVTDRELDRLAENVRGIRTSLGMLGTVGRLSLKGQAWDSARSYAVEVEMPYLNTKLQWIEAMKNGNARFRSEAQRLPSVNCLDKDLLEEEFDYWEDRLDREYDREHPRSSVISRCRRMMRDINSKLVAIDVFVQATGGIYDRATGIQNVLDRADTEIKKVSYNPSTNTINFASLDYTWVHEFEVMTMDRLKEDGLTEEQIKLATEYGISIGEVYTAWEEMKERNIRRAEIEQDNLKIGQILYIWSQLNSEEDKALFQGLIKKELQWALEEETNPINTEIILNEVVENILGYLKESTDQVGDLIDYASNSTDLMSSFLKYSIINTFGISAKTLEKIQFVEKGKYTIIKGVMNTGNGTRFLTTNLGNGKYPKANNLKKMLKLKAGLEKVGSVLFVAGGAIVVGKELFYENQDQSVARRVGNAGVEVGIYAVSAMAGAKVGATVGGIVGSIVPGAGTVVGAGAGAVVGAVVGVASSVIVDKAFDWIKVNENQTLREWTKEKVGDATEGIARSAVDLYDNINQGIGNAMNEISNFFKQPSVVWGG
jgi:hypothetical protein